MFSSIWWRITVPNIVIILVTTLGLTLVISTSVTNARYEDLSAHLTDEALLMVKDVHVLLTEPDGPNAWALNLLANEKADILDQRVTIIGANGVVLGDSHANYLEMGDHLYRPEIQQAIVEGRGTARRYSTTLSLPPDWRPI
jgi:two-component system phosphate regulon sensor histidine kinase PhoR